MVVTNGESPLPFPAQQSIHAYTHTHTYLHTPAIEADRLSYSRYRHPSRPSTLMLPRAYPTPRPSTLS
ncbi:hypothetical protein COCCADRAFT_41497 [Bipolaris zeicola 26-R-13]|uniref:Uncharacterized protein n=1 Tax=Cochliobolus carbonum (strain 26-R-13) TaxID=930089 RepID=W6XQK4_COCC2|nr:uncharacterized protein COCCADRAFT_41497 [Bipolaris zeicola 26-R-13]EUC27888.1 hypothetical protein COCCADRAFT_41497 [Bipolaris zeicola 26-R-13]